MIDWFGQIKIGYVLSERIRTEYEEFKEAEAQLQIELKKVQSELDVDSEEQLPSSAE